MVYENLTVLVVKIAYIDASQQATSQADLECLLGDVNTGEDISKLTDIINMLGGRWIIPNAAEYLYGRPLTQNSNSNCKEGCTSICKCSK